MDGMPPPERIKTTACNLLRRYGRNAVEIAKEYVVITARSGEPRKTDEALLVLTEIERLAEQPSRGSETGH